MEPISPVKIKKYKDNAHVFYNLIPNICLGEFKSKGKRCQVHKKGEEIAFFEGNNKRITDKIEYNLKIEMLKAPIFGLIYRKVVVLIDRKSAESRAKCIQDLKIELAAGQSILIFPEGTMNRTNNPLAHFYDGAFRLAIETQTPIVPLIVINARNLLSRNYPLDARPGPISVILADPIPVDGLVESDLPKLKEQVYRIMEELIITNS